MTQKLSSESIQQALETLPSWRYDAARNGLMKSFKFKDFDAAWAFMNRTAAICKEMNHHPDWTNVYNRVDIALTTHDAGGVTQKDIKLAKAIEQVLAV